MAATVVPASSELHLGVLVAADKIPVWQIVAVATLGNSLGGMSSYLLGYLGRLEWINRYLGVSREQINRWKGSVNRWGGILALNCWMPWIGDPIAVALGFFRVNWLKVLVFLSLGKFLRYLVLATILA